MSANYGNVLAGNDDDLTTDLFRMAMLWAMNRQGSGSGSTPNFYPIPLTPEQKRVEDEKWRVYQAGGSNAQKEVQGLARQALSQMQSGPSNFSFMSPEMKGQSFAGGFKLPTFNFATMPSGPTAPPPPQVVGNGSPLRNNESGSPSGAIAHKQPWDTGYDSGIDRTHFGSATDGPARPGMDALAFGVDDPRSPSPLKRAGMATDPGAPPEILDKAQGWWATFQREHPNWASMGPSVIQAGLAAAFGMPGAVAGRVLKWLLTRPGQPAGPTTNPGGNNGPVIPPGGTPGNVPPGGV